MKITFVLPDLRRIDRLRCDVLALSFFDQERPLRGASGLVDWRLCGLLSRLLAAGRIDGSAGELTLVPVRPRLPFDKLLLLGLGARETFDEGACSAALGRTFAALSAMKTHSVAMALPGRPTSAIGPDRALTCLLDQKQAADDQDDLVIIEDADGVKAMQPVLARH